MVSPNFRRCGSRAARGWTAHEGWVGDLSADFVLRDRDTYVFSISAASAAGPTTTITTPISA